jgi:putative endopeptidase
MRLTILAVLLAAMSSRDDKPCFAQQPPLPVLAAPHYGAWGLDLSAIDSTVKPGDDFYSFVNGNWQNRTEIPPDRPFVGVYADVVDQANARLRTVILDAESAPATASARMIANLYLAYMDTSRLEQLGDRPLRPDLARIRAISTKESMARWMAHSYGSFGGSFFGLDITPDVKAPNSNYVLRVRQSGLGMERESYLGPKSSAIRNAYRDYVTRTLKMVGWSEPDRTAGAVVEMETRIAEMSWNVSDRSDATKMYNPVVSGRLPTIAPGFPWATFLEEAGVGQSSRVILGEVTAIPKIATIYSQEALETLKAWAAFHATDQASPYLAEGFARSRFDFRGKMLEGLQQERRRADQAVPLVSQTLGDLVGREYVAMYFPPASKAIMLEIAGNVKSAMATRIRDVGWMSPATKEVALRKLAELRILVGYPDKWRDYSGLAIDATDLYGDMQRAKAFEWKYRLSKLHKRVDRDEWLETPQTSDASASFTRLQIAFPAGYLLPPIFDSEAEMAVNYGAIGGVIGHEITHHFDNQGRRFDASGAMRNSWTPEDSSRFERAAAQLAAQVDTYDVLPGLYQNGRQTLGENIADLGGLLLALDAYRLALKGKPAPVIDGLTGEQRLLMSWAQMYRTKVRDDLARRITAGDVHSQPKYRVIGPVRNVDAWYTAFGVRPGEKYYLPPEARVRIW